MKKIYNDSVFSKNSITSLSRTLYKKSQDVKMTMNSGKFIPIFIDEVIPGDNFKVNFSSLIYATAPNKKPILDKLVVDVYSFFTPKRLLDKNFEKIWCNYKPNADYSTDVNLTYSTIQVPSNGFALHSLADYLGVPPGLGAGKKINHLPFRGAIKIWDEWMRPQYLQSSIWNEEIPDSGNVLGVDNVSGDWQTDAILGGDLPPVAKTKDYFTTSLPFPQVGAGELLNLGGVAPVIGASDLHTIGDNGYQFNTTLANSLSVGTRDGETISNINKLTSTSVEGETTYGDDGPILRSNMVADLSSATGISIRELRWVFQTQLVKEMDLFGNRLFETINIHFGVVASDSRFQRSEFLGHSRFYIGSYQVTQTSKTDTDNPMGSLSSYMVGRATDEFLLNKAFPEPGYLYIFACIRIANHTYAEGCHRMFRKYSRFDDMWPAFTTVGDQETYSDEIYFGAAKNDIFGYQTRYSEYKYLPDRVAGLMRPTANQTQLGDQYAFTDYYGEQVYLSGDWIWEDKSNIDRTFALSSSITGAQFVAQWYFQVDNIRVTMSGQPGLVDHSHRTIW